MLNTYNPVSTKPLRTRVAAFGVSVLTLFSTVAPTVARAETYPDPAAPTPPSVNMCYKKAACDACVAKPTQQQTCPVVHHKKPKPHPVVAPVIVAPPPPPVPSAPDTAPPPPPPPPQLVPITYDALQPIRLPLATGVGSELPQQDQDFVNSSDCNDQGFWNAVEHPINAQCRENTVTQTSTIVGTLAALDGKAVFIASGTAALSYSRESRGTHGQGWLLPAVAVISAGAGIAIAQESVDIARESLKVTENYNGQISGAITSGKFTSLFGSLNCGNAGVSGSTTGSVSASCNVANTAVNSSLGNGGTVSGLTSPVSTITATYGGTLAPTP